MNLQQFLYHYNIGLLELDILLKRKIVRIKKKGGVNWVIGDYDTICNYLDSM